MGERAHTPELIDLSHFCYTEDDRPTIQQSWSRGDFTYATNGHVAIRVPRLRDVPENDRAPDVEGRILSKLSFDDLRPIAIPRLPPLRFFAIESDTPLSPPLSALESECVRFAGALFNLRYVHLLCWLPGLKMGPPADVFSPSPFGFDGGVGCLMPMKEIKGRPPVYDFGGLPDLKASPHV